MSFNRIQPVAYSARQRLRFYLRIAMGPPIRPDRLFLPQLRKLMRQRSCPAAVTQRVHLYPGLVLPLANLERPRTVGHPKVPMMAPGAPGELSLASNDQATPAALVEGLAGGELELELEHGGAVIVEPPDPKRRRLGGVVRP